MQVIAFVIFNLLIFSYTLIQMNQITKIKQCATDYLAVYAVPGYPILTSTLSSTTNITSTWSSLLLWAADNSTSFDLLGPCPWSLQNGTTSILKGALVYLDRALYFEWAIVGISGIGNLAGIFFAYFAYTGFCLH